jgi:transcriptional regulator with XRE-family HTH domain
MLQARNYKKIRVFTGKEPKDVVKGTRISKQNISAWENEKNNPGPEFLDLLAEYFKVPVETFSVKDLTDDYLKNIFSGAKSTQMPKADDNNGKMDEAVWEHIEKSEKYTVVPTIILDKYEILSNREIESRENTLQEVRATMKIAIAAKDQVIAVLNEEIAELREKLKNLAPAQKAN